MVVFILALCVVCAEAPAASSGFSGCQTGQQVMQTDVAWSCPVPLAGQQVMQGPRLLQQKSVLESRSWVTEADLPDVPLDTALLEESALLDDEIQSRRSSSAALHPERLNIGPAESGPAAQPPLTREQLLLPRLRAALPQASSPGLYQSGAAASPGASSLGLYQSGAAAVSLRGGMYSARASQFSAALMERARRLQAYAQARRVFAKAQKGGDSKARGEFSGAQKGGGSQASSSGGQWVPEWVQVAQVAIFGLMLALIPVCAAERARNFEGKTASRLDELAEEVRRMHQSVDAIHGHVPRAAVF